MMVFGEKAEVRASMLNMRNSLSTDEIVDKSLRIMDNLAAEEHFRNADTVSFYIPKGSEVDTTDLLGHVMNDKEILVPATNDEIEMVSFVSFDDLRPGKFGVPEPSKKIQPGSFSDVVLVPGVCFGLCMHRLGYGMGYYDRFLSRSPAYRIGLAYDFQIVEKLPSHENDQRMDMIITEKRIIKL
jgi:5-formyltetrahydrofolate cyclo-ligase